MLSIDPEAQTSAVRLDGILVPDTTLSVTYKGSAATAILAARTKVGTHTVLFGKQVVLIQLVPWPIAPPLEWRYADWREWVIGCDR